MSYVFLFLSDIFYYTRYVAIVIAIVSVIFLLIMSITYINIENDEVANKVSVGFFIKISFMICCISSLIVALLPQRQTLLNYAISLSNNELKNLLLEQQRYERELQKIEMLQELEYKKYTTLQCENRSKQ